MRYSFTFAIGLMLVMALLAGVYALNENNQTDDDLNQTISNQTIVNNTVSNHTIIRETLKNRTREIKNEIRDLKDERKELIEDFKERLKENHGWLNISGKNITIKELSNETKEIIAGKINAKTGLNLTADDINGTTDLRAYLSNGRFALIKYMPNVASEKALEVLKAKCEERNCTVELKEVGKGNQTKVAYELSTDKDSKILFLFGKKMRVVAQVDAETGQVLAVKKPWWAFLAKEKNETNLNENN